MSKNWRTFRSLGRLSEWTKKALRGQHEGSEKADWRTKMKIVGTEGGMFLFEVGLMFGTFQALTYFVVNFTFCVGPSMLPTINETGDVVLIDTFSYRVRGLPYKTGDVVISSNPYDPTKTVCKRIAATAGEVILISRDVTSRRAGSSSNGITVTKPPPPDRNVGNTTCSSSSSSSSGSYSALTWCSTDPNNIDPNKSNATVQGQGQGIESSNNSTGSSALSIRTEKMDTMKTLMLERDLYCITRPAPRQPHAEPLIIPPGHVWLAGDNTANSTDSRFYGPVPVNLLRGRVFLKFIPSFPCVQSVESSTDLLYRKIPVEEKKIPEQRLEDVRVVIPEKSTGIAPEVKQITAEPGVSDDLTKSKKVNSEV